MNPQWLVIITIVGWGIGSLFYKLGSNYIHPIMVETIAAIVYIILIPLPFLFINVDRTLNTHGIIYSILGAVTMLIGTMGYLYALRTGGAGVTTTLVCLYPALTLLLSCLFLGEKITGRNILGVVLALLSFITLSKG